MAYQGSNKNVRRILTPYNNGNGSLTYLEVNGNTSYMASELMQRRKDLGLTQKQLGEKLGVDRNTIARWENGKVKFPPVLVDLALESLENKYKKEVRKLARADGTGGESDYDASSFPSWLKSPVMSGTFENKPKKEIRKPANGFRSWIESPVIESGTND
jgi:transcriptional regulator with XRE-family HTH domain